MTAFFNRVTTSCAVIFSGALELLLLLLRLYLISYLSLLGLAVVDKVSSSQPCFGFHRNSSFLHQCVFSDLIYNFTVTVNVLR